MPAHRVKFVAFVVAALSFLQSASAEVYEKSDYRKMEGILVGHLLFPLDKTQRLVYLDILEDLYKDRDLALEEKERKLVAVRRQKSFFQFDEAAADKMRSEFYKCSLFSEKYDASGIALFEYCIDHEHLMEAMIVRDDILKGSRNPTTLSLVENRWSVIRSRRVAAH